MENLACYTIPAFFSQERMITISEPAKLSYQSKDGKEGKALDAMEWLMAICSYLPALPDLHPDLKKM